MNECWITVWEKYWFPAYLSPKKSTREEAVRIEEAHKAIALDRPLYRLHITRKPVA